MSNKHPHTGARTVDTPDDLEQNPGIGQSKGGYAREKMTPEIAGENTVEGDVMNDTGPNGEVRPNQRGRENK